MDLPPFFISKLLPSILRVSSFLWRKIFRTQTVLKIYLFCYLTKMDQTALEYYFRKMWADEDSRNLSWERPVGPCLSWEFFQKKGGWTLHCLSASCIAIGHSLLLPTFISAKAWTAASLLLFSRPMLLFEICDILGQKLFKKHSNSNLQKMQFAFMQYTWQGHNSPFPNNQWLSRVVCLFLATDCYNSAMVVLYVHALHILTRFYLLLYWSFLTPQAKVSFCLFSSILTSLFKVCHWK